MLDSKVALIVFYYLAALMLTFTGYHLTFAVKNIGTGSRTKGHTLTEKTFLLLIIGIGMAFRLLTAPIFYGHDIDMNCFRSWSLTVSSNLFSFYNSAGFVDYPPVYIYILFIVSKLASLFGVTANHWAYAVFLKLPSILADVVTAYLLYRFSEKYLQSKYRFLVFIAYVFNPLTLINSTIWGQVDSLFTLLILNALIYISKDDFRNATIFYVIAVLMKPQGLIFLPVLFFELLKKRNLKTIAVSAGIGLLTFFLIILPFSFKQNPLWIYHLYVKTTGGYSGASVNAFNLFALLGANWKDDTLPLVGLTYAKWGLILIVSITLFTAFLYLKGKGPSLGAIASVVLITGVFVLSSKMHERYMFPAAALTLMAFVPTRDWRLLLFYLLSSITGFINTAEVFKLSLQKIYWVPAQDTVLRVISTVNVLLLAILIYIAIDLLVRRRLQSLAIDIPEEKPKLKRIRKR